MIETILIDYLENVQSLQDIPIVLEEPDPNPYPGGIRKFVRIQKTGSGRTNHLDRATVAFQSYADTLLEAAQLNDIVKRAVFGIIQLDTVSRVELNSDYEYTREDTKQPRYQAVFDFVYYDD